MGWYYNKTDDTYSIVFPDNCITDEQKNNYIQSELKYSENNVKEAQEKRNNLISKNENLNSDIKSLNLQLQNATAQGIPTTDIINKIKEIEALIESNNNLINSCDRKIKRESTLITEYNKILSNGITSSVISTNDLLTASSEASNKDPQLTTYKNALTEENIKLEALKSSGASQSLIDSQENKVNSIKSQISAISDDPDDLIDSGNTLGEGNEVVVIGTNKKQQAENVTDKQTTSAPKSSSSSENTEELIHPLNLTDPIVYHDPEFGIRTIVGTYDNDEKKSEDNTADLAQGTQRDQTTTRVDGIYTPVVLLNNMKIELANIDYFHLHYTGFTPTMDIMIKDLDAKIQKNDVPGLNNSITIAIVPAVEDTYKTIKLDFYIESFDAIDQTSCVYHCKWKYTPFEKNITAFVVFHWDNGHAKTTSNQLANGEDAEEKDNCNSTPQLKPNTWELLHCLAHTFKLGFQSTKKCRDIEDRRQRWIQHQRLFDFIPEQVALGGLDENSIFDAWIDLYGYITLVNIPWVFQNIGKANSYAVWAMYGVNSTDALVEKMKKKHVVRTITNNKQNANDSNLQFLSENCIQITDNDIVIKTGTENHHWQLHPEGVGEGTNTVDNEMIIVSESSIDGKHTEDYEFGEQSFLGFEMGETPVLIQKRLHDRLMDKMQSNRLEIELTVPNLGLQRGTVINVHIWEYNPEQKRKILQQEENLKKEDKGIDAMHDVTDLSSNRSEEFDENIENIINTDEIGIPNAALSGFYYINGMEFVFEDITEGIKQKLILTRIGTRYNYNNKYNMAKFVEYED